MKSIEEEANKRIEDLVAKRVAEELERRREEIEAEVMRRVEEAKKIMEAQMLQEMEKRKQEQLEEARRREVRLDPTRPPSAPLRSLLLGSVQAKILTSLPPKVVIQILFLLY